MSCPDFGLRTITLSRDWVLNDKKCPVSGVHFSKRFDDRTIECLEALRWWDWDEEKIRRAIPLIRSGDIDALAAERDTL